MKTRKHGKRPGAKSGVILLIGFAVLVAVLTVIWLRYDRENNVQARGVSAMNVGQLRRVEYNGRTYVEKPAQTSILLIGTDETDASVSYGARQGGQADFLMLLVIDHNDKEIHQLQIDRDTIAQVETLGILGNPIGTKAMQICLAHSFGSNDEENCRFLLNAVENLLEGMTIDYYIALNMDSIGRLNDALGGVTVTLEDDYSMLDPQMTAGTTLRLTGEQARIMVRSRMEIGDGSNASRMRRQSAFLSAAVDTLHEGVKNNPEYITDVYDAIVPDVTANIQRNVLLNEANQAYAYDVRPVETLQGEHRIGDDGFMEFHVAPGMAEQWVMNTLYFSEN